MRVLFASVLGAAVLALCARGFAGAQSMYPTNATSTRSTTASSIDSNFVVQAAKFGVEEVRQGQIYQTSLDLHASSFAKLMLADWSNMNKQLTTLASQASMGGQLMVAISSANAPNLSSAQAYLSSEVAAHESAIAVVEQEIKKGNDANMRSFGRQMLPVIRAQLKLAEQYLDEARTDTRAIARQTGLSI